MPDNESRPAKDRATPEELHRRQATGSVVSVGPARVPGQRTSCAGQAVAPTSACDASRSAATSPVTGRASRQPASTPPRPTASPRTTSPTRTTAPTALPGSSSGWGSTASGAAAARPSGRGTATGSDPSAPDVANWVGPDYLGPRPSPRRCRPGPVRSGDPHPTNPARSSLPGRSWLGSTVYDGTSPEPRRSAKARPARLGRLAKVAECSRLGDLPSMRAAALALDPDAEVLGDGTATRHRTIVAAFSSLRVLMGARVTERHRRHRQRVRTRRRTSATTTVRRPVRAPHRGAPRRHRAGPAARPEPLVADLLDLAPSTGCKANPATPSRSSPSTWPATLRSGRPWWDREVHGGPVLYVAAEGAHGMRQRLRAWEVDNQTRIPSGCSRSSPSPCNSSATSTCTRSAR